MENAALIAGLGNPGSEYARTRHNAGFMLAALLASRWRTAWQTEARFQVKLAGATVEGRKVWLCQPLTYMNLSGEAVSAVANYYRIAPVNTLVVVDDADLPLGELRMRPKGGDGGHHGLESVTRHLGTTEFPRLRIGIGRQAREPGNLTGHVLGPFTAEEQKLMEQVLSRAADQVACWLSAGVENAMNQFNGTIESARGEPKDSE